MTLLVCVQLLASAIPTNTCHIQHDHELNTNHVSSLQIKKSLQVLLEEANAKKVHLEVLNDRCEVLMDYSAHTPVRDMTVQLQAAYTNALTNLQVSVTLYHNFYPLFITFYAYVYSIIVLTVYLV